MLASHKIPCVILCGGKSSRMGEDKSLLPFSNYKTLTQYQYNRLKPFFQKVLISSKTNKFKTLEIQNLDEILILDKTEIYSPIIALKTILQSYEKVFILTVDNPFVSIQTITKLIEESKNTDITIAKTQRIHNLCGVFTNSCLKIIDEMLKQDIHKVNYLIKQVNSKIVSFEDENEFINLNKQEDYKRAKELEHEYNNYPSKM